MYLTLMAASVVDHEHGLSLMQPSLLLISCISLKLVHIAVVYHSACVLLGFSDRQGLQKSIRAAVTSGGKMSLGMNTKNSGFFEHLLMSVNVFQSFAIGHFYI